MTNLDFVRMDALYWPSMPRTLRDRMIVRLDHRRAFLQLLLGACVLPVRSLAGQRPH